MTDDTKLPVKRLEDSEVSIQSVGGGGMVSPRNMAEVIEFAELMSYSGPAIRKVFRGNKAICMALTLQAMRWETDPFALANKAYIVNDMLAYEAQLIAAIVHTRAPLKRRPTYKFDGKDGELTCKVSAEFTDGTVQTYSSPPVGSIRTKNSPLWKDDPEQQLGYFSITRFARRYCPEVILGIYSQEEAQEFERRPEDATVINEEPAFVARLAASKENPMPGNFEGFDKDLVDAVVDNPPNERFPDAPQEPDVRAETYKEGRAARDAGIPLDQAPDALEGDYAAIWQDGWKDRASEISESIE